MTNLNDLARRVAALFSSPKFKPMRERDLAKALHLDAGQRGALREALRQLETQGLAAPSRGGRWSPASAQNDRIDGIFRVRQNGTCWIIPDDPQIPPLKIEPANAGVAMNGDRIQAAPVGGGERSKRLFTGPGADAPRREARVLRVVERKRQWVVGILQATPYYAYIVPRDPLLRSNIKLTDSPADMEAHLGHLLVVRITEDEPSEGRPVTATFVEDLGDPDSVANDIPAILYDHGLQESFPTAVSRAAARVPAATGRRGGIPKDRVDLRDAVILTIDPADAHDYDDAVSIESLPGGRWKLGVHIADVAEFVPAGGEIDREALRRGNSTYLVDRVIRMLPEDLTVRVCSLQPNEDHLTHSVEMIFTPDGTMTEARTFRSVIRSKACLAYEQVQTFFDTGKLPGAAPDILQSLTSLRTLARNIRARRFAEGALDFALPEAHCLLDQEGNPTGFVKRGASEAYNLIEECMLAANRAVASKIFDARVPGIYRVHDEPSPEQWARMATELNALGQRTPPEDASDINRIARAVIGRPEQYIVTLTLLRNMKRAVYEAECRPHFGLGFARYAHFTSPIRRYPDLVLHRILNALESGARRMPYTAADIAKLAIHCSETERESAEMESQSIQLKRIRYYASMLARGETGPFPGVIVSLNPKGLIVELNDSLQQGMLPYYALGKERYYVSDDGCSASAHDRRTSPYRLGQPVEVGLAAVDEHLKRVDFFLPSARENGTERTPRRAHSREEKPAHGHSASSHSSSHSSSRSPRRPRRH